MLDFQHLKGLVWR